MARQEKREASLTEALFREELDILETARARQSSHDEGDAASYPQHYQALVKDYDKLLKTTMKLSRISDIQGRTLKNQEQQIQEAHQSLQHMEQLRRDLISDISHELGTPLMAVRGYVKAVLDGQLEVDLSYLKLIYDKLQLMNQLIEDLFQLSAIKANQQQPQLATLTVHELVTPLMSMFMMDGQDRAIQIKVEVDFEQEEASKLELEADHLRIEQVTGNLVQNALKYSPGGTEILLRFSLQGQTPERLLVEVIDQGIGVNPKDQPYIFERLYRGSDPVAASRGGSGLGLAICKEMIERHGGSIGLTSVQGQGSNFYYDLPIRPVKVDR